MRAAPERDPLRALLRRADAEDAASLSAHLRASGEVAVMLDQDGRAAMDAAIPRGKAAMEAAFALQKKRAVLAQFFASRALIHVGCPLPMCKRARRCASPSLRCVRGFVLTPEEEAAARARFRAFIACMTAPEEGAPITSFRGAGKACEPGIQRRPNVCLDSGSAHASRL